MAQQGGFACQSRLRAPPHYGEPAAAAPCSAHPDKGADMPIPDLDASTRTDLEAAAFRRLLAHLRERTDVQNIDLMNLAGFCRNCLSRWYREEAAVRGITIADPDAREIVYGMPYKDWQKLYQKQAGPEQQAAFAAGSSVTE
jgi:hypothetical protein